MTDLYVEENSSFPWFRYFMVEFNFIWDLNSALVPYGESENNEGIFHLIYSHIERNKSWTFLWYLKKA